MKISYIYRCFIFLGAALFSSLTSYSQVMNDSTLRMVEDSVKKYIKDNPRRFKPSANKFKVTPIYGLFYSKETELGANLGMEGRYRNGIDTLGPLSTISINAAISTNLSFLSSLKGRNYSQKENFVVDYSVSIHSLPRNFWGIGYVDAINSPAISYTDEGFSASAYFLYRSKNGLQVGPSIGYEYNAFDSSSVYKAPFLGLKFVYDSRSNPTSPTSGWLVDLDQKVYTELGDSYSYKVGIIIDYFLPLWDGGVLGVDLFSELNFGVTHWTSFPLLGGSSRMRGYYQGRFRDKNIITTQLELRQKIYKQHGAVIWIGGGNVFPDFSNFNIKHSLPTYGIGYRFDLWGQGLLRIDAGVGSRDNWTITVGINHAF